MKLLFAGSENKRVRKLLKDCKVDNILVSYYYITRRNVPIEEYLDYFPIVALDSGAFTMIEQQRKSERGAKVDHETYLYEYLEFIDKYKGRFYWAANYDVNLVVGDDRVYSWNEMFEQIEKEGQRICYVSHDYSVPFNNLREYFSKYNMIGVSGDHKYSKDNVGYFSQVYNYSRRFQKVTHGFAMTNFVSFDKFPFYTCDSTTYLGGAKYGTTYVWNGAYFETWDYLHKHRRKTLGVWCEKWGVDYEKFIIDDIPEVTRFNIMSWLENEKNFNLKTKNRQWWNQPEMRVL